MFYTSHLLHSLADGPLSLPPPEIKAQDFDYLMRRFQAETFRSKDGDWSVLVFESEQSVPNGVGHDGESHYSLCQPFFLARGSRAVQLYMAPGSHAESSSKYFDIAGRGPLPDSRITINRDFDTVTVTTSLPGDYAHTRQYLRGELDTSALNYEPYPATPVVYLHHETLGYVCFAFEKFGCHPYLTNKGLPVTGIRCFRGDAGQWSEVELFGAVRGGLGTGNLRFETTFGEFFVPGENSAGPCTYTPRRGLSVECRVIDLGTLQNPLSPSFDIDAYKALRSLGLPPIWPHPDFL